MKPGEPHRGTDEAGPRARWHRRFPVRLALTTAATLVAVMLALLVVVYTAVASLLIHQLDARALAARRVEVLRAESRDHRDEAERPERGSARVRGPSGDDGGEAPWRWSIHAGGPDGPVRPALAWLWPDPDDVRVARLGDPGSGVVVTAGLDEVAQTLKALRWWLAGIGAVGTLAVSGVAFASARKALEPVDRMIAAASRVVEAQRISPETLAVRIPGAAGDATLERLTFLFNTMLARLRDALSTQARFVDDASHELRTPLGALRADLEVALQEHPEGSPCRAPLERALAQVVRLSRLADDLLALARYERGGLVRPVPGSDLTASIRQALADVRHLAERAGVTVVADLPDRLEATCDPAAVARVVTNLLRNAVEASPQGGTVTVAAGQEGLWAWIEVEDEGPGMTPEQAARCFEPFYHSRPASAAERDGAGTGLGLAISKAIVDAHDGRITLDTAPERGTRVRVWLPLGHRQPLPPAGLQEQAAAG